MALATTRTAPLTASQLIKLGQQKLETEKSRWSDRQLHAGTQIRA